MTFGCTRSHPHENMDEFCETYTVLARKANKMANNVVDTLTERGERYGKFVDQASCSQAFKNVLDYQLRIRGKHLHPDQQESLEMILHKIARIINGDPDYVDSWHDIAGYAKLVEDRLNGIER